MLSKIMLPLRPLAARGLARGIIGYFSFSKIPHEFDKISLAEILIIREDGAYLRDG